MNKLIIIITAIFFTPSSYADVWYNALQGICNLKNNTFKIQYIGKYNEEGEKMIEDVKSKTENECTINNVKYELKSHFFPGSPDYTGRCGAHEYVEIQILKDGKFIFKGLVQGDCHYSKDYISSVLVETDPENVVVEKKQGTPY